MPTATDTGFRRFLPAADSGVIVSFADAPDETSALLRARAMAALIRAGDYGFSDALLDVIPGMNNIIIQYDPIKTSSKDIMKEVEPLVALVDDASATSGRHWRIPVLYGGDGGPDLDEVADRTGMAVEDVISRHLAHPLTVAIMGFMPGNAYLKGTDPSLYLPRRSSPRKFVPALTLGIVMDMTVIYPLNSPGGWNLIGRVPVRVFEPRRDDPVLFRPGDTVSFRRVDEAEFGDLDARAAAGETIITPEVDRAVPRGGQP